MMTPNPTPTVPGEGEKCVVCGGVGWFTTMLDVRSRVCLTCGGSGLIHSPDAPAARNLRNKPLTRAEAEELVKNHPAPDEFWTDDAHAMPDAPAAQGAEVSRDAAIAAAVNAMPSDCSLISTDRLEALCARASVAAELAWALRKVCNIWYLRSSAKAAEANRTFDEASAALARAEAAGVTMEPKT